MKRTILFLFTLAALFGEEQATPQRDYTKALLDLANAQAQRLSLSPENIEKAKKEADDAISKAGTALNAALQAQAKKCGDMKPPQQLDTKAINDGVLGCMPKEEPKK